MPLHGAFLAELVTGAAQGLVSAVRGRFDRPPAAPVVFAGGPGFPGAPPVTRGTAVGPMIGEPVGAGVEQVIPSIIRALPRIIPGLGGAVAEIGSRVLGDEQPGVRTMTRRQLILAQARAASPGATAKKIIRSARECGIDLAAATFGLNVLDVCFLIAQPPTRRSRGISAADMRRTRATIRKVTTIQHQLKDLSGPIRRRSK